MIRKALWPLLVIVTLGVLLVSVLPTRTFLAQRASIQRAQKQLDVLDRQNAQLAQRAKQLQSDDEIERLARERYNLVKPGEQAYAVLPAPSEGPTTTTTTPPLAPRRAPTKNPLQKAWDAVTGLF